MLYAGLSKAWYVIKPEPESREAFEDRKALAKRMGEECESKLLLPMLMMLLTILILVMYPAVVSFQM